MRVDQRALPQIIERQRRQHEAEPGDLDRRPAEMTEVGIERFGAGDGKEHGAEREQPDDAVMQQKCTPWNGLSAHSTPGSRAIQITPGIAIATNQIAMIGPNSAATFAVPRDWNANSTTRMTTVNGTTKSWNAGVATSMPSTADSTDSAGVMTASP